MTRALRPVPTPGRRAPAGVARPSGPAAAPAHASPRTPPVTPPRTPRVPLSVLDLLPDAAPGPLPASAAWTRAVRAPRHPGVASGESALVVARRAGRLGLPFAVDHRTTTRSVREATAVYRSAFVPAVPGSRPYVLVVADVVVAPTADAARALAAVGGDRFVGSPAAVVAGLDVLVAATGADELMVTSTATTEADRRAGHALLAAAWGSA